MKDKYFDTMSKIKLSEDFKKELIKDLKKENVKKCRKEGVFMKLKRIIISIMSIISLLVGSGVVYAALGGTINGVPVLEWMGIKFSNNYVEYVEPVENQVIENDDVKIVLESTVGDAGFIVLQFRVNISQEKIDSYKESEDDDFIVSLNSLSLNDPVIHEDGYNYTELSGANYNLIIDGEDIWLRGRAQQAIDKLSNTEYLVYQMYFLDEYTLEGKTEFKVTLNDISISLGEDWIGVDGSFEANLSKDRALNNTKVIVPEENTILEYKKMEKSIEEIYITPLQNIIKIKTVYKDIDLDDLTYVLDDDYIGMLNYLTFDQNENNILSYSATTERRITYEDGTVDEGLPDDFEFGRDEFENATYEVIEYIAVEQSEDINSIDLRVYEESDYYGTISKIMQYTINLETNKIEKENLDELIFNPEDSTITDEYKIYYKNIYGYEYEEIEENYDEYYYDEYNSDYEEIEIYEVESEELELSETEYNEVSL